MLLLAAFGKGGQQAALGFGQGDGLLSGGEKLGQGDAERGADFFQRGHGGHHVFSVPGGNGGLGQTGFFRQLVFRPASFLPLFGNDGQQLVHIAPPVVVFFVYHTSIMRCILIIYIV